MERVNRHEKGPTLSHSQASKRGRRKPNSHAVRRPTSSSSFEVSSSFTTVVRPKKEKVKRSRKNASKRSQEIDEEEVSRPSKRSRGENKRESNQPNYFGYQEEED